MVGAGVDHQRVLGQLGGDLGAGPVRQGQEHHVVPGQVLNGGLDQHLLRQRVQVRGDGAQPASGLGVGGDRSDGDLRVVGQQAKYFATGIAAGARDSY